MSPGRMQLSRFNSYTVSSRSCDKSHDCLIISIVNTMSDKALFPAHNSINIVLCVYSFIQMVQVTGNLKVHILDIGTELGQDDKQVVGFVGECRLIESTASILEISIPQSYFTTTISLDMKIVSVESQ